MNMPCSSGAAWRNVRFFLASHVTLNTLRERRTLLSTSSMGLSVVHQKKTGGRRQSKWDASKRQSDEYVLFESYVAVKFIHGFCFGWVHICLSADSTVNLFAEYSCVTHHSYMSHQRVKQLRDTANLWRFLELAARSTFTLALLCRWSEIFLKSSVLWFADLPLEFYLPPSYDVRQLCVSHSIFSVSEVTVFAYAPRLAYRRWFSMQPASWKSMPSKPKLFTQIHQKPVQLNINTDIVLFSAQNGRVAGSQQLFYFTLKSSFPQTFSAVFEVYSHAFGARRICLHWIMS